MKKILILTDFSECAKNASDIAIGLAKKMNAEIHFLNVINTPVDWKSIRKEQEKNFPETIHEIGRVKAELSSLERTSHSAWIESKTFMLFDVGQDEIINHINEHHYDLIIMGSHGAKGFKELIGSNTQRIVRYSPAPVLVIKNKLKNLSIKNIVFASTWDEDINKQLEQIIRFSENFSAKLHLLYVNLPDNSKEIIEIESIMKTYMRDFTTINFTMNIYDSINEEQGIIQFSKIIDADIIGMITHGKSGFKQLISPSLTESIVNHSLIPILSVNLKAR